MGFLWMMMILIGIGFSNYQLNYIFLEKKIIDFNNWKFHIFKLSTFQCLNNHENLSN
jgi:hypothetical protein